MDKMSLLKLKKAILVASMTGMTTLTACAPQGEVKGAKRIESNEVFNDRIYIDENGNTVIEVKPERHVTEKGVEYFVPSGYMLTYDENGKPIGRKIVSRQKR